MISLSSNNSLIDLEINNENQIVIEDSINRKLLYDDKNEKSFTFKCPFNAIQSSIIGIIIVMIVVIVLVVTKNISS